MRKNTSTICFLAYVISGFSIFACSVINHNLRAATREDVGCMEAYSMAMLRLALCCVLSGKNKLSTRKQGRNSFDQTDICTKVAVGGGV